MADKSFTVSVKSNRAAVSGAVGAAISRALEICGGKAETYAKKKAPKDTGNLMNSITHAVAGKTVTIGTAVKYAPYQEFGTGVYASNGQGRKTPWKYQDAKGVWHKTSGNKPHPYLRPALEDHITEYKAVFERELGRIK